MQASFEIGDNVSAFSPSLPPMKKHIESYCWIVTLNGIWDFYCIAHRNDNKMNIECEQEITYKNFALMVGVLAKIYRHQLQKDHCIRPSKKRVAGTVERMLFEEHLTNGEEALTALSYKKRKAIYNEAQPHEFNHALLYDMMNFKQ